MAIEALGRVTWEELTVEEQTAAINLKIWESDKLEVSVSVIVLQ